MSGSIQVHVAGQVATVTIDNPCSRNSLDRGMCLEIAQIMPKLDRRSDVGVITLRGAGADFCSGAALDGLDEVLFDGQGKRGDSVDRLSQADAAITAVRKPTVALVRGICMGGGWQIAAACDLVLAADDSRIAITPSKLGMLYPRVGLERLVRRVGEDRAKYLLFTAAEVTPDRALSWGLVTDLVAAGEFEEKVLSALRMITGRSQYSIVTMKKLMGAPEASADAAWEREWHSFPDNIDLAVGRKAFADKQTPSFAWTVATDAL